MRLLLIHADSFSFAVTEKTSVAKVAERREEIKMSGRFKECLVAFVAVEKGDEKSLANAAKETAQAISGNAEKLGTKNIVVYPYAHLSSELAAPRLADRGFYRVYEELKEKKGYKVKAAPFGYYKSFKISCKGHPLSELGKTITTARKKGEKEEAHESAALAAEKRLVSHYFIVSPEGEATPLESYAFLGEEELQAFVAYERSGSRVVSEPPPHVALMRELEYADYEKASDAGNFRWYPKGELIKRLMETRVTQVIHQYGGMEVETPIMYDYNHPHLARYLDRFPARQYILKSEEKEYFLRFAACFGQYLIGHDAVISYRHLPLKLYELTHYSFRREQTGELAGLRRLRTFTMPDMHTLVRDVEMAKEEFLRQVDLCTQWCRDLGIPVQIALRAVRSFYDEHRDFCDAILKRAGGNALLEIWDQRFFYFVVKFELNFVDAQNKAACLSTVQLDVENAERFEIHYIDESGSKRQPLIMHTSVSGGIDRNVYALLEHQARRMKKGQKAIVPTWLAPTQVRIIPVSEPFFEAAHKLIGQIPFRVDLDDRDLSVSKRIREAEKEWVPYIVVFGEREKESGMLAVRPRVGEQFPLSVEELNHRLQSECRDFPMLPLNLPVLLSKRPIFVG